MFHNGVHDGKGIIGGRVFFFFFGSADCSRHSRRKDSQSMSRRLRSRKDEEDGVEQVLERMVKGMRNEMNTVIWRIECSRDISPEALKNMVRNSLDAVVGAVEKVTYGVSDGLAKE